MPSKYEQWRRTHPPIMGGAGDEDDDGDTGTEGTGTGTAVDEGQADGTDGQQQEDETQLSARDTQRILRENQRMAREMAAIQKERRQRDADAKKADEERKAKAGEWQKLAEEARAERDAALTDLENLRTEIARDRQRGSVEKIAEGLNFIRPRRAYALLADDLDGETLTETLAEEQLITAALKRIAKSEPELVDNQRRSGAPVNGGRRDGGMSPQQLLNRGIANALRTGKVDG